MDNWIIGQVVDLQGGLHGLHVWHEALLFPGDNLGHTWQVKVLSGGKPVDMTGFSVQGNFLRADGNTVPVFGSVSGDTVSVTLTQECYAVPGDLQAFLTVSRSGRKFEISAMTLYVGAGPSDSYVNPGNVIPNLSELLAAVAELQEATAQATAQLAAVKTATDNANTATKNAQTATTGANSAAVRAETAAAKWDTVALEMEMLPPDGEATGSVTQTSNTTTISLEIPQGRITNATLYMDDTTTDLIQRMPVVPEVGIDYAYDDDTTELFMRVRGY